ncbi:MAG: hypothetical protein ACE5FZ_06815 [Nitrospiria bacterium]
MMQSEIRFSGRGTAVEDLHIAREGGLKAVLNIPELSWLRASKNFRRKVRRRAKNEADIMGCFYEAL